MRLTDREVLAQQYLFEVLAWVPKSTELYTGIKSLMQKVEQEIVDRRLQADYCAVMSKEGVSTRVFPPSRPQSEPEGTEE